MELRHIKEQVVNTVYIVEFRFGSLKCFSPVLQLQAANHAIIIIEVYYKCIFLTKRLNCIELKCFI